MAGAAHGPAQGSYQRMTAQQEPPAKRFKGGIDPGSGFRPLGKGGSPRSSGDPSEVGEVRFYSEASASQAVEQFDNRLMMGQYISVALDPADSTKVLVTSMPAGIAWQELKDHFAEAGEVHYANIGRSAGRSSGGSPFRRQGWWFRPFRR